MNSTRRSPSFKYFYFSHIERNYQKEIINQIKETEKEITDNIDARKDLIREKNSHINKISSECDKLTKEKNAIELKLKEINHKKENLSEHLSQSNQQVIFGLLFINLNKKINIFYELKIQHLLESNEWIKEEQSMFEQANTIYDFTKYNMKEVNHRLHDIKNRKEKLSKQVDMRAMGMLAKKEEEYEELNKKRTIVLGDKSMLESTIEDLEKVKLEILNQAFQNINKDFGNIFKTLLPGCFYFYSKKFYELSIYSYRKFFYFI
jgi:structural maintenance of chromosome 2